MGTDIHMFMEVKRQGQWQLVQPEWATKPFGDSNWGAYSPYLDRNYLLFQILADVRSAWSLEPIAPPRGLPPDMSNELQLVAMASGDNAYLPLEDEELRSAVFDHYGGYLGDHSYSWLSLDELLAYDWKAKVTAGGQTVAVSSHVATFTRVMGMIKKLADRENLAYDQVRLVFGFDS